MAYSIFDSVNYRGFGDAESGDKTCENNLTDNGFVQNTSGRQQTGSYGYRHDYTQLGSNFVTTGQRIPTATDIVVLSFAAGVDAAPNAAGPIFGFRDAGGALTYNHITLGTDRKLRFYDKNGTQVGPASTTLIPTTGMQEVHIVFDGKTLSTVYIKVYFGGTEELAFDTGITPANFWCLNQGFFFLGAFGNNTNKNFTLYTDDFIVRVSSTASDAPHLTAYPRLRGEGGNSTQPTSMGAYDTWSPSSGTDFLFYNK